MKRSILCFFIFLGSLSTLQAQEWMTNLDFAKKLATTQNKMLFVMWESATLIPYPVLVSNDKGELYFVENLFDSEELNRLIWEHFIPVSVNEDHYEGMYDAIEERRSQLYLDKFNDDSIKIMDANGTILNMESLNEDPLNLTNLIATYALDTSFLSLELKNYAAKPDFYNTYYLSSKYLDFAMYANSAIRPELLEVSMVYLNDAVAKIPQAQEQDRALLQQRSELLELEYYLLLNNPKKVIRNLKRLDDDEIDNANTGFVAFLYYTSYRLIQEIDNSKQWMAQVSTVDLKKSDLIVKLFQ